MISVVAFLHTIRMKIDYHKYLTTRNMIIAGAVLVAGTIAGILITRRRREAKKMGVPSPGVGAILSEGAGITAPPLWPLKRGSGRNDTEKGLVRNVQRFLNIQNEKVSGFGSEALVVDGLFGPLTEAMLQRTEGVSQVSKDLYNSMLKQLSGY